jgi:hypothetical protein
MRSAPRQPAQPVIWAGLVLLAGSRLLIVAAIIVVALIAFATIVVTSKKRTKRTKEIIREIAKIRYRDPSRSCRH